MVNVDTDVHKKIIDYLSNADISVDTLDLYELYEAKKMLNKLLLSPHEKIKKIEVDKKIVNSEKPTGFTKKAIRFLDDDELTDIEKNEVRKEFIMLHSYFESLQYDEQCALLRTKIKEITESINKANLNLPEHPNKTNLNLKKAGGGVVGLIMLVLAYKFLKKNKKSAS